MAGSVPTAPVIAGMGVDNYYAWQIFFILPLVFAVWVLASGVPGEIVYNEDVRKVYLGEHFRL